MAMVRRSIPLFSCGATLLSLSALQALLAAPLRAEGQVLLRCDGTLVEARGQAERKRVTDRLRFSLALEAEGPTADGALGLLQDRLAVVRRQLQGLQVQELQVSSPSTWQRVVEGQRPAAVQAQLQVSGALAPSRLQPLVRQVGALPGVRLAPVSTQASAAGGQAVQRQLLRDAYLDARRQALEIVAVLGRSSLVPLDIQLDGGMQPMPMLRAVAADASPPFDPRELQAPVDRLALSARFCAR
ncbi:MAG: hypothetical protein RLZZ442_1357 [Cyanobacteriota bacterium]|jgi:uncharacterized protein YggE